LIVATSFAFVSCRTPISEAQNTETKENLSKQDLPTEDLSKEQISKVDKDKSLLRLSKSIATEHIKLFGEWDVDEDSPFTYFVQEDPSGQSLVILNQSVAVLYRRTFAKIHTVRNVWALRGAEPQLAFEFDEGGQDSYIQMLDFDRGKVVEVIDEENGNNSFGADAQIHPQFRKGINPAKEPYEIILRDFGLASPVAGKYTRVLRFQVGEYRTVGEYDGEVAGDFVEKILKR
jgi:hypothetical protein